MYSRRERKFNLRLADLMVLRYMELHKYEWLSAPQITRGARLDTGSAGRTRIALNWFAEQGIIDITSDKDEVSDKRMPTYGKRASIYYKWRPNANTTFLEVFDKYMLKRTKD